MARLSGLDLRHLAEIEDTLDRFSLRQPDGMSQVVEPLRTLLDAELGLYYDIQSSGVNVNLGRFSGAHSQRRQERVRIGLGAAIGQFQLRFGGYNPIHPAPEDRNRVRTLRDMFAEGVLTEESPGYAKLFPSIGFAGYDQVRAIISDGAAMLGWFGGIRAEPFTAREERLLKRLVAPVHRRLRIERDLGTAPRGAVLDAVLETLVFPTFVVDRHGRIQHLNVLARRALESDGPSVDEGLRRAVQGRAPAGWEVTPLGSEGMPPLWLVSLRGVQDRIGDACRSAAKRWGLTPRQAQVLEAVCRGETNRSIGNRLGCAENTVEVHVTALLSKAQVANRAALVSAVWEAERS